MSTDQAVYNKTDALYTYPQGNLPTAITASKIGELLQTDSIVGFLDILLYGLFLYGK
ncbi:hypothetical protein [Paenibacillus alginolyticus]|uniref:hypothetical protein n=1 Tax=Paenibacillus alginolyticus TaxID=59839 RepID=UPI002DBE5076|nr:hypothetical protein [Paenibacillus alginolyticus]MEC0144343.1 hypothetical protein [Paenibacillus alginolyticus]NRF93437.1 hypothetical protein [Paenibacillus frigoriresistens]